MRIGWGIQNGVPKAGIRRNKCWINTCCRTAKWILMDGTVPDDNYPHQEALTEYQLAHPTCIL